VVNVVIDALGNTPAGGRMSLVGYPGQIPKILYTEFSWEAMPKELFLLELWRKYGEKAEEIRVKRYPEYVKLKARLAGYLYTIKLPPDKAEQVIAELKAKNIKVKEV
jgi:large subunit ribosomal protein L38e